MFSIQYDKGKMKSVIQGLRQGSKAVPGGLRIAITASVLDIQGDAAINAPYQRGILRKGISHKVESAGGFVTGYVGSNIAYARIQEMGGQTGRNHAVRIRPKRYLGRAIDSNKPKIRERLRKIGIIQR